MPELGAAVRVGGGRLAVQACPEEEAVQDSLSSERLGVGKGACAQLMGRADRAGEEMANLLGSGRLTAIMPSCDCAASIAVLHRLGTVLGTICGRQLSSWRETLKFLSNFDTVRWPSG